MRGVDLSKVPGLTVPVTAWGLERGELLWRSKRLDAECADDDNSFVARYAYVLPGQEIFEGVPLDQRRQLTLHIDRYGGDGLGGNTGSGRAGSNGRFQIKGIGRTPMVNPYGDADHFAGDQNLIDAAYEVIVSEVLRQIMPSGVVECLGLICVGDGAANSIDGQVSRGALLVRRSVLRPAHLMRLRNMDRATALKDTAAVRQICKYFLSQFSDDAGLQAFVGAFSRSAAQQFAFARLNGIAHMVLSPSNLSMDGAWLDLTNACAVPVGVNFASQPEHVGFYEESVRAREYAWEIAYTLNKFSGARVDPAFAVEEYDREYESWLHKSFLNLLGFTNPLATAPFLSEMYKKYRRLLEGQRQKVAASPCEFDSGVDKWTQTFLECFFCEPGATGGSFLHAARAAATLQNLSISQFVRRAIITFALIPLARFVLSRQRLMVRLRSAIFQGNLDDIRHIVQVETGHLFEKGNGIGKRSEVRARVEGAEVSYDIGQDLFNLRLDNYLLATGKVEDLTHALINCGLESRPIGIIKAVCAALLNVERQISEG